MAVVDGFARIGIADPSDAERWNAFVERSDPGNLSHLFGWKTVYERTYHLKCHYLLADTDGSVAGVLPLVEVRGLFGGVRLASVPFLDRGGIIANREGVAGSLLAEACNLSVAVGATGVDLRGGEVPANESESEEGQRFRFLLDLRGETEDLWARIGPKVRNQVRKSEKSGLASRRSDPSGLANFYKIFARNMKELGSPVHSRRLFEEIFESFGDRARLYLTFDSDDQPVAGGVSIRSGSTVSVPWASSLRSVRPSCPNHSLYWRILKESTEESATLFDFGRSSLGTGTYQFKKQWRAQPNRLSWMSFDNQGRSQEIELLDPRRHARLTRAWRLLPLPLATTLGPWVRKRVAN